MLAAHFKYLISDHRLPCVSPHGATMIHGLALLGLPGGKFLLPFEKSHKDWEFLRPGQGQNNQTVPGFEVC